MRLAFAAHGPDSGHAIRNSWRRFALHLASWLLGSNSRAIVLQRKCRSQRAAVAHKPVEQSTIGMADTQEATAAVGEPVVIKKYANRRLYNTETSSYVTLEHLSEMVKKGNAISSSTTPRPAKTSPARC